MTAPLPARSLKEAARIVAEQDAERRRDLQSGDLVIWRRLNGATQVARFLSRVQDDQAEICYRNDRRAYRVRVLPERLEPLGRAEREGR